jgi:hypothetical protein
MPRLKAFTMSPHYECLYLLVSIEGKVLSQVAAFDAR